MAENHPLEALFNDPEKYRAGPNYRASNIVFPVEFEGQRYIVKRPRLLAAIIEPYYVLQDKFFLGARRLTRTWRRAAEEIANLECIGGVHAPKLAAYSEKMILREFLEGTDFRSLSSDDERKHTLEGAIHAMAKIHERFHSIGDTHVKNAFQCKDRVCWLDHDGVYREDELRQRRQARDLVKFVYTAYTATRNPELAVFAAEKVKQNYPDADVLWQLRYYMEEKDFGALRLWFPARLPLDGKLNAEIKRILTR
ncbi:MAG TPA: hypothetical protein HA362_04790 [Nanoarchaeota archaeon]|nr:hypothetical protein [Nanoarchaeota archaeon]